jgi:hypothetical protein
VLACRAGLLGCCQAAVCALKYCGERSPRRTATSPPPSRFCKQRLQRPCPPQAAPPHPAADSRPPPLPGADHGFRQTNAVVLGSEPPSRQVRTLLNSEVNVQRSKYIQGSSMDSQVGRKEALPAHVVHVVHPAVGSTVDQRRWTSSSGIHCPCQHGVAW